MEFPRSLFCLNLAYNIDDKDVIEQLPTNFSEETEQCIPIALRNVLEVGYLPPVPFFSSRKLAKYLSLLWNNRHLDNKLLNAASDGLVYLVAYFLDRGTDIHANDWPLIFAVSGGHTDTVKLLLDRKADIHVDRDSPLMSAIGAGHIETVKLLLDRKADIHVDDDYALKDAIELGYTEIANLLRSYMR
jgi:hypothetical protein